MKVHIIDVDSGNLQSLKNSIKQVGDYEVIPITEKSAFVEALPEIERLIFPGVGNFGHFLKELKQRGLVEPIKNFILSGGHVMGICVGLQSVFQESAESFGVQGIGLLDIPLLKFSKHDPAYVSKSQQKPVPHIGWNTLVSVNETGLFIDGKNSLFSINPQERYYFVHSFAAVVDSSIHGDRIKSAIDSGWEFKFSKYGSETFIAAACFKNYFATQFHPEKSGSAGLKVISAFLKNEKFTPTDSRTQNQILSLNGLTRRIIACLDVRTNDSGDLVVTKGDQYDVRETTNSAVRNLGKPVELATKYYQQGADEITFLNITSFRDSPLTDLPMLEVLRRSAEKIFVPLTVGGGIRDIEDPVTKKIVPAVDVADLYFRSGADKVSIGSEAVKIAERYYASDKKKDGTSAIEQISARFGNQAVVISVDPKRIYVESPEKTLMKTIEISDDKKLGPKGERFCFYLVTSQGGRKLHDLGALELCLACEDLGAGEILLNSIDHDGSNNGFDLDLLHQVKSQVSIPVIASSGAGNPQHFKEVFELDCGVDAALGAGIFHRGEYEVNDVKSYLRDSGFDVRYEDVKSSK